ncbi:hypothetical protein RCL1_007317 [Eukaryota sp. TZLM3-RCL]
MGVGAWEWESQSRDGSMGGGTGRDILPPKGALGLVMGAPSLPLPPTPSSHHCGKWQWERFFALGQMGMGVGGIHSRPTPSPYIVLNNSKDFQK